MQDKTATRRDRLFLFLAPALLLAAPPVTTMGELSINPAQPGALIALALVVAIGLALGLVAALFHRRRGVSFVSAGALALAALLFADTIWRGHDVLTAVGPSRMAKLGVLVAVWLLATLLFWGVRKVSPVMAIAGAGAMFLSALVGNMMSARAQEQKPAPVVYVILDEMLGLNGFDPALPGAEEARDAVLSVLDDHQFRVFPSAFSRHFLSHNSIPAVMNFDERDDGASPYMASDNASFIEENRLFQVARERGYEVVARQSKHILFCTEQVSRCETFESFNPTGAYVDFHPPVTAVVYLLERSYSGSYLWYAIGQAVRRVRGYEDTVAPDHYDVHGFTAWFDEFVRDVQTDPAGKFYLSHFLMPHQPAVLNAECEPQPRWVSPYYLTDIFGLTGSALDETRRQYYGWYFEQVHCTVRKIDEFLTAIDRNPDFDDATVVIHGDHGSRISAGRKAGTVGPRDMIDNFATLYAIRRPGVEPGVDGRKVSVQRLTAEFFSGKPPQELGTPNDTVVLLGDEDEPVLREMPDF